MRMKNNIIKRVLVKALRVPNCLRRIIYVRINRLKFWLNDIDYGKNMRVYNHCYLKKARGSKVLIGDNFVFTSGDAINPLCRNIRGCIFTQFPNSHIIIGNNVGISSACIWAKESIVIGNNVKIGGGCVLIDTDAHNLDYRVRAVKEAIKGGGGRKIKYG